jgi:hypothetical protein
MATTATRSEQGPAEQRDDFDDARWRARMQQADIADELFLPLDHSTWVDARFRLLRGAKARARTRITGVRFAAADPERQNLEPERAVQTDFHRLVDSLIRLRREPAWRRLCLSGETFRTSPGRDPLPRRQFGLLRAENPRLDSDPECARRSHAAILRAIRQQGFVVTDPVEPFRPDLGLLGLRDWVDRLRLRRRRTAWPWLLLLAPLLWLARCEATPRFFSARIETASFLLVVDRSSSMEPHFELLRTEAQRLLGSMIDRGTAYADVISYCGEAASCLGGIREVDGTTRPQLEGFLRDLQPGGGTRLAEALEIAAAEVRRHERPTTLIVLTDAEDATIPSLLADPDGTLAAFGGVEIRTVALTPRLFGPDAPAAAPHDAHERAFAALAALLGGRLGTAEEPR